MMGANTVLPPLQKPETLYKGFFLRDAKKRGNLREYAKRISSERMKEK